MRILYVLACISGISGTLLCGISIIFRLTGSYWIAGFQTGTALQAGNTAMIFGCLCFLAVLARKV